MKIFVTVQGGVGEVCEETVPKGFEVEIIDLDCIEADPATELRYLSEEARAYLHANLEAWGRGNLLQYLNPKPKEHFNCIECDGTGKQKDGAECRFCLGTGRGCL